MLPSAMQEGMLTGGTSVRTDQRTDAAPPRPRRGAAALPRPGLVRQPFWGTLPSALVVVTIALLDPFVVRVSSGDAPLLLAVVLGGFIGGARAGVFSAAISAIFLAIHDSTAIWPPMWTNDAAAHVLLFVPCGIAAAFLVGLLQRRALQRYVREREHGERMATLERVKSQFLNVASHELRGPLGVVSGYVSMVRDGSFGELSGVDMRRVAPVLGQKEAEMTTLVNEMLDTARLEESRLTLQLGTVDLGELMQRAVDAVSPLASKKHEILYSRPR